MYPFFGSKVGSSLGVLAAEIAGASLLGSAFEEQFGVVEDWTHHYLTTLMTISALAVAYKTRDVTKPLLTALGIFTLAYYGRAIGGMAGEILGGYLGRIIARADTTLWDENDMPHCYTVSMLRYACAGACFERTIRRAPLLFRPLRATGKALVQTVAFSLPDLAPVVWRHFTTKTIDRRLVATLLYDTLQKKVNAQAIARGAIGSSGKIALFLFSAPLFTANKLLEKTYYPTALMQSVKTYVSSFLSPYINSLLGVQHSHKIIVGSIQRYLLETLPLFTLDLAKTPKENKDALEQALIDRLKVRPNALFDPFLTSTTKTLKDQIHAIATDLVGIPFTVTLDPYLDAILPIHISYYLTFLTTYHNNFTEELSLQQDEELLLDVSSLAIAAIQHSLSPKLRPLFANISCFLQTAADAYYAAPQPTPPAPLVPIDNRPRIVGDNLPKLPPPAPRFGSIQIVADYFRSGDNRAVSYNGSN